MSSKGPVRLVTFATSWGSAHGGINSFNRDFCSAIARHSRYRVACVVPGATREEKEDARKERVTLLELSPEPNEAFPSDAISAILRLSTFSHVEFWVGHDVITGEIASRIKKRLRRGQLGIVMHQSYESYRAVKHTSGDLSAKSLQQKKLFALADKTFAVGPLLHQRLLDLSNTAQVIVPGLRTLAHRPAENALRVVIFGRLTADNALIKGVTLAGHAVAEAVRRLYNAHTNSIAQDTLIKFVGADPGDAYSKKLKDDIEKRANRCVNVQMIPYVSSARLSEEIAGANLSLMLSWHEGFGLAGWEAIGAGIPLVLSKNTGVYQLLEDLGGRALGCVRGIDVSGSFDSEEPFRESDLESATGAILEVVGNMKRAIKDASDLRKFLVDRGYTWKSMATTFVDGLEREISFSMRTADHAKARPAGSRRGRTKKPKKRAQARKRSTQVLAHSIGEMVATAGLTAFYPSRNYYHIYRASNTIDAYVTTAKSSVVMVSINLMTGIPFDGLCDVLEHKLKTPDFSVMISLLNPRNRSLIEAVAPVLDMEPTKLEESIWDTLKRLLNAKGKLSAEAQGRFSIRVHNALPFGSAIMLDHADSSGRVQIETKVYKVAVGKSFAFEVGPSGASGLYNTLVSGYLNLVGEGIDVDSTFLSSDGGPMPREDSRPEK